MRVSARTLGSVAVLDLAGRLTVEEDGRSLDQQVNGLTHKRMSNFIVNLYCVTDIDSSGIAQLLRCYARAREQGGNLKLLHLSHRMTGLFARRGLLALFELFNNEREAVRSFLHRGGPGRPPREGVSPDR
jgi:anti-anti-sigma factor